MLTASVHMEVKLV